MSFLQSATFMGMREWLGTSSASSLGRTGVGIWSMGSDGVVIFIDFKEGWILY